MIRAAFLLLAATGTATSPTAERVAGAPVECIHLDSGQGLVIADQHSIVYRDGARTWRTAPQGHCVPLRPFDTLLVEIYSGQVCRGDRFQVIEGGSSIPSGVCRFGAFTPYTRAAS